MGAAKDEVIRLERRLWDEANNPAAYRQLMTDDQISVIEPMGVVPKAQALELAVKAPSWRDVEMTDLEARELAPNCVVLTYRGSARRGDGGEGYRARISSVYVHRQGRWQLGFTQHQPLETTGRGAGAGESSR